MHFSLETEGYLEKIELDPLMALFAFCDADTLDTRVLGTFKTRDWSQSRKLAPIP